MADTDALGPYADRLHQIAESERQRAEVEARNLEQELQLATAIEAYVQARLPQEPMSDAERASYVATLREIAEQLLGDDQVDPATIWGGLGFTVSEFRDERRRRLAKFTFVEELNWRLCQVDRLNRQVPDWSQYCERLEWFVVPAITSDRVERDVRGLDAIVGDQWMMKAENKVNHLRLTLGRAGGFSHVFWKPGAPKISLEDWLRPRDEWALPSEEQLTDTSAGDGPGRRAARDILSIESQARATEAEPQHVMEPETPEQTGSHPESIGAMLPRALPPDEERSLARRGLLSELLPVEGLEHRTDDLLDKLWEFWNDAADLDQLVRDGWSEHGIAVWQNPYRYDIEQVFAANPERLAEIRSRNDPPEGDEYVGEPMSDADAAAWVGERRWIAENPDLWEARNERSKLGELLLDRDREARLESAGFNLERVLMEEEIERARSSADAPGKPPQTLGRPQRRASGYSDEERRRIAREIREQRARNGTPWKAAAQLHGISEDTAQRWVAWLKQEEGNIPHSA